MKGWYGGILPGFREPKTTRVADIAVDDKPICVMAFGRDVHEYNGRILTDRPKGRKDYLISFVAKGTLYETPKLQIAKENSMVLYKPNQPQQRNFYDKNPAKTYWIHFSGNNVEEILNKYGIKDGITTFDVPFPMFTDIIDRMYVAKVNPFWQDICDCLLMELFIHIGAASKITEPKGDYQRLIQYMKENCTRNLPIKAYADFIGFSEVYFVRFFKKASKLTPHAYLIKLKMEKACNLLVHTNTPINQIATKVGYKTARYFSKAFFENFDMSPSEYRNNSGK